MIETALHNVTGDIAELAPLAMLFAAIAIGTKRDALIDALRRARPEIVTNLALWLTNAAVLVPLLAVPVMTGTDLIPRADATTLIDAYRFLRKTEHQAGGRGDFRQHLVTEPGIVQPLRRDQQDVNLAGPDLGLTLIRPARKDEKAPRYFPNWLRQRVEAIIWALKNQLGLERHGGRVPAGLWARIVQRLLVASRHFNYQLPEVFANNAGLDELAVVGLRRPQGDLLDD